MTTILTKREEAHREITQIVQKAIDHPGDHTASGAAYHIMEKLGLLAEEQK